MIKGSIFLAILALSLLLPVPASHADTSEYEKKGTAEGTDESRTRVA
ncbi:MAG: hypothetical protein IPK63_09865 [Candidatus Competibacteraceae bacterium]|nr:hypothetical protein [Candidatus Competibacteraceae bacterium]